MKVLGILAVGCFVGFVFGAWLVTWLRDDDDLSAALDAYSDEKYGRERADAECVRLTRLLEAAQQALQVEKHEHAKTSTALSGARKALRRAQDFMLADIDDLPRGH